MKITNIAIFASGSGTNAQKILETLEDVEDINVKMILSNKSHAFVLQRAKQFNVPIAVFDNSSLQKGVVLNLLKENHIDFIVLAGFLLKISDEIIRCFPKKIVNIHPALLPKYGGKGMYGDRVHQKVIENGEVESGITIHFVNEVYDDGEIIFQAKCSVGNSDTVDSLTNKIHQLEHEFFSKTIINTIRRA